MDFIKANETILVLTEASDVSVDALKSELLANTKGNIAFATSKTILEHDQSNYDTVLSGYKSENVITYNNTLLEKILKVLKPNGILVIFRNTMQQVENIEFELKTNGFINVKTLDEITCNKPNYETGSASKLTLKPKANIAAVWKLDDTVDEEVETIDPDNLLDEDDFKKPDPASLRVCGTTGKRKACKDCSCGLADELAGEADKNSNPSKSSCGSCYLGDAFRCASCPYLGMPAFKPGEKIQLSDNQLKADA